MTWLVELFSKCWWFGYWIMNQTKVIPHPHPRNVLCRWTSFGWNRVCKFSKIYCGTKAKAEEVFWAILHFQYKPAFNLTFSIPRLLSTSAAVVSHLCYIEMTFKNVCIHVTIVTMLYVTYPGQNLFIYFWPPSLVLTTPTPAFGSHRAILYICEFRLRLFCCLSFRFHA